MMPEERSRVAKFVVTGLIAGGAIGAGVGIGFYPPWAGITAAVLIAIYVGVALFLLNRK